MTGKRVRVGGQREGKKGEKDRKEQKEMQGAHRLELPNRDF